LADLFSVKASVKAHDDLDIVQAAPDELTAITIIYSL